MLQNNFQLDNKSIGRGERLFLIAGPCVVEDRDTMFRTAESLKKLCTELDIACVFKSSYRKANRSSEGSPEGPGLEKGLEILALVKRAFDLPVLTDIHQTGEIEAVAEVADILQIPAFLSRQSELIRAAAASGRIVNIKKGQFMGPDLLASAVAKAEAAGGSRIMLTERGTFFGYGDLVVDFRSLSSMASTGCPVVYDATHSVQRPGVSAPGGGLVSGGDREQIYPLARAAVAAGVDGLFIETHPEPSKALSDAASMLSLDETAAIVPKLVKLSDFIRENKY